MLIKPLKIALVTSVVVSTFAVMATTHAHHNSPGLPEQARVEVRGVDINGHHNEAIEAAMTNAMHQFADQTNASGENGENNQQQSQNQAGNRIQDGSGGNSRNNTVGKSR